MLLLLKKYKMGGGTGVPWEYGLVNSTIQTIWDKQNKNY